MRKLTLLWAAGVGLLSVFAAADSFGAAAGGDTNASINGVADLLEKGNVDGAQKAAKDVATKMKAAKDDVETLMHVFKLRTKKGIGVGSTPNAVMPDGIEAKIEALARDNLTPAAFTKEKDGLGRLGFVVGAVGQVAESFAPEKDQGKAKRADWLTWSASLTKAGQELAAAAKGSSVADVKKAASKIKQNCDSCHAVFK